MASAKLCFCQKYGRQPCQPTVIFYTFACKQTNDGMKKALTIFVLSVLCYGMPVCAQNRADELMQQAQENLEKQEYTKARYFFMQAYSAYAAQSRYDKAVACGIKACTLYFRENYYKEAFGVLSNMEQFLADGEQKTGNPMPALHFSIKRKSLDMYVALKNSAYAKEQLDQMDALAKAARNDSIDSDLLYARATYYYMFGQNNQGDNAFNLLVGKYKEQKKYDKVDECYKALIGIARRTNNSAFMVRAYDKYMQWNDSVNRLLAQDQLAAVQQKYDDSLATIAEKDTSLSAKQYIIIGLCVLAAILAAALVLGGVVLLRFVLLARRQKKAVAIANEHNELKSQFIRNISAQMEPTLDTLDATNPGVQALHAFSQHIQELSELESTLSEPYPVEERNISVFCEGVMDKVRATARPDVTLTVNAPKLDVKISAEPLEHVLLHLLGNAVEHTQEGGKIWLDFKKRGAHTHQFVVSNTGCGVPEELRANLFKPFTEVKVLTEGDGLGLPICALIAAKMNGSLVLDESYTKGARFVLELRV